MPTVTLNPTGRGLEAVKAVERGEQVSAAMTADKPWRCHLCAHAILYAKKGERLPRTFCEQMGQEVEEVETCNRFKEVKVPKEKPVAADGP